MVVTFKTVLPRYHGPNSAVLALCAQHKLKIRDLVNTHLQSYQLSEQAQPLLLSGVMMLKEGAISMALLHQDASAAQQAKQQFGLLLKALS